MVGGGDGVGTGLARFGPEDAALHDLEAARRQGVVDSQVVEFAEIGCIVSGVAAVRRFGVELLLGGQLAAFARGRE